MGNQGLRSTVTRLLLPQNRKLNSKKYTMFVITTLFLLSERQ
jgi:hypothetical protein